MKYWNKTRIRLQRERREKREQRALIHYREREESKRTYTSGDARKNARLMLEAIGSALHRRMLTRLRAGGAMSVSHLARPFRIMLPDAMRHMHILEHSGLITTEKRGRIRYCIYNPAAIRELATYIASRNPFDVD